MGRGVVMVFTMTVNVCIVPLRRKVPGRRLKSRLLIADANETKSVSQNSFSAGALIGALASVWWAGSTV